MTSTAANTAPAITRRANSAGSGCTNPTGPNQSRDDTHSTPAATAHHTGRHRCRNRPVAAATGSISAAIIPTANHSANAGGQIWRIDAEMTLHDAAMTRFGQWWTRARRAGHAFAEGAALHGASPERHWVAETRRALFWGAGLPAAALATAAIHPAGLALLLAYPAQFLRLAAREGSAPALFSILGKFAETTGIAEYWLRRLTGRNPVTLIEYK